MKMKYFSKLTFFILLLVSSADMWAQEKVMFKEGRRWIYRQHTSEHPTDVSYFSYCTLGDTVIDGISCIPVVQMWKNKKKLAGYVREEDRRVFFREESNDYWTLIYDFGLRVGDYYEQNGIGMRVTRIDTVRTAHASLARWHFCCNEEDEFSREVYSYIEGIGGSADDILRPFISFPGNDYVILQSCYDGPTCIIRDKNWGVSPFSYWTYSSIQNCEQRGHSLYGDVETWANWLEGSVQRNGKTYQIIHSTNSKLSFKPYIREDMGKVYTSYECFAKLMTETISDVKNYLNLYPVTENGEVILYNFNLSTGDSYPDMEIDNGVYVAFKDTIMLRDMELRRRLILSNGQELIEGLGCVNSKGGYFLYLYDDAIDDNISTVLTGYIEAMGTDSSVYTSGWLINPALKFYGQGTRWIELRLDTTLYDSWYSLVETKDGQKYNPNFQTVEYYIGDDCLDSTCEYPFLLRGIYSRKDGQHDSLVCYLAVSDKEPYRSSLSVVNKHNERIQPPLIVYDFSDSGWLAGLSIGCKQIGEEDNILTNYGEILFVDEKKFGGSTAISFAELDNGMHVLKGIGFTQWPGAECILGPLGLECITSEDDNLGSNHFKSILVYFEHNGEILYNVWPYSGGESAVHSSSYRANISGDVLYNLQGIPLRNNRVHGITVSKNHKFLWK